jgi:tRNA A-37 threonylcarbamoyl transferase component Bud32
MAQRMTPIPSLFSFVRLRRLLSWFGGLFVHGRSLAINPAYEDLLREAGLTRAEDFLSLADTIVSGHPGRQVSRVTLGSGPEAVNGFLKKEHRVPWKERLANAWAGFGPVSKSWREAETLRVLRPYFPGCPEWIAAGEAPDGRAFLLLRELPGASELRQSPAARTDAPLITRRALARSLGATLARLHDAGFVHGDLYVNHVLVNDESGEIAFIDWQRATRLPASTLGRRWHDLATLSATLPSELAGPRTRLACLQAYLQESVAMRGTPLRALLRRALSSIRRREESLSCRRHIRTKRLPSVGPGRQSLLCLEEGNGLCVTPAFRQLWPEDPPHFLAQPLPDPDQAARVIRLPDGSEGLLVCRPYRLPWHSRFGSRRRLWTSPERLHMSTLFRLQRYGVSAPEVLAVGERFVGRNDVVAFLLTRSLAGAVPLGSWLREVSGEEGRSPVLAQAGALLARLHDAGFFFRGLPAGLAVRVGRERRVVLAHAEGLSLRRGFRRLRSSHYIVRLLLGGRTDPGWKRGDLAALIDGYLGSWQNERPASASGPEAIMAAPGPLAVALHSSSTRCMEDRA